MTLEYLSLWVLEGPSNCYAVIEKIVETSKYHKKAYLRSFHYSEVFLELAPMGKDDACAG